MSLYVRRPPITYHFNWKNKGRNRNSKVSHTTLNIIVHADIDEQEPFGNLPIPDHLYVLDTLGLLYFFSYSRVLAYTWDVGMRSIIQPERERKRRRRIIAKHNKPHEIRGDSFIRSWVEMERGSQGISFQKNIYWYTSSPLFFPTSSSSSSF